MIILNQDNIWLRVRYISSQDTSSETHDQTRIRLQSINVCETGRWFPTMLFLKLFKIYRIMRCMESYPKGVFQPYKAREYEDDGRNRF